MFLFANSFYLNSRAKKDSHVSLEKNGLFLSKLNNLIIIISQQGKIKLATATNPSYLEINSIS